MPRDTHIEDAVGAAAAHLRATAGPHPSAGQLSAYQRDELAPAEMEELQDHLALCRECSELVLDLARLGELAAEPEAREWDERRSATWRSLQASLELETPEGAPVPDTPARVRWSRFAVAALVASAIGAAVWQSYELGQARERLAANAADLARAEQRISELEEGAAWLEPQTVVPSLDLFPPGFRRRSGERPSLVIPPAARMFVLQFHVPDVVRDVEHRLRIQAPGGEEVWVGSGLYSTAAGTFRVALPSPLLPSGRYRLQLERVAETSSPSLTHFELTIESP